MRYEVTGEGRLTRYPEEWNGLGAKSSVRVPYRWMATIACWNLRYVQFPSSRNHPTWEWNIYDHQHQRWLKPRHFTPPAATDPA